MWKVLLLINNIIAHCVEWAFDAPSAAISLPSVVQVDSRDWSPANGLNTKKQLQCNFRCASSDKSRRHYKVNAKMK